MPSFSPPKLLRTGRLLIRCWAPDDAAGLLPVLAANVEHLRWIPPHVAGVVPVEQLRERLSAWVGEFDAGRVWRFGLFAPDGNDILGEVGLFPRSAEGRVEVSLADRVEIGYWLRADATGTGLASEAAAAMVRLAATIPGMIQVEIRCDPRNVPSAAVPRRLGFRLASGSESGDAPMVWVLEPPFAIP